MATGWVNRIRRQVTGRDSGIDLGSAAHDAKRNCRRGLLLTLSEVVLFEVERRGTRDEIADYLRTVADRLAGDDSSGSGGEFSIE